jgi:phage protein D
MPGGGAVSYSALSNKYRGFEFPQAYIELNGKPVGKKKSQFFISDVNVELTSGYEASVVNFRIYNTYNQSEGKFDFKDIERQAVLGVSVALYLGYLGVVEPVFVGFVAGVSFGYDGIDPPYIEITGMDAKGAMMSSNYAAQVAAKSYGEAVKLILERAAYENMKSAEIIKKISVTGTSDKKQGDKSDKASAETIEMVSESDYEFIVKAAKKFNYEFYIDRGTVLFRPSKANPNPVLKLGVGEGILTFDLNYSLTGMVQTIEARSMDVGVGKIISSKIKYEGTLSSSSRAKALIKGSSRVYIDPSIHSQEDADARAASLMEEMSYRLGTAECECIGIPDLLPGDFIEINVGSPADNKFYITNVTHNIDDSGSFRTKFTGIIDTIKN